MVFPISTDKATEIIKDLLREITLHFGLFNSMHGNNCPTFVFEITQKANKHESTGDYLDPGGPKPWTG